MENIALLSLILTKFLKKFEKTNLHSVEMLSAMNVLLYAFVNVMIYKQVQFKNLYCFIKKN